MHVELCLSSAAQYGFSDLMLMRQEKRYISDAAAVAASEFCEIRETCSSSDPITLSCSAGKHLHHAVRFLIIANGITFSSDGRVASREQHSFT